jgi:single-stranded-DNA-specific exonuclease
VLAGAGWNSGVVGIAASKVVEQCQRPAILLSIDEESGIASGSARSIPAMNMIEALDRCRDLLERAGGHALAAGLSLKLDKLQEFEARLDKVAAELTRPEDLIPSIAVDEHIDPEKVSWQLMNEISKLEPFGPGNPEPLFVSPGVSVVEARRVGGDGSHLKMKVRGNGNGLPIDCIGFGLGDFEPTLQVGRKIDVCYNIRVNSFNGHDTVQMAIKDIKQC